MVKGALGRFNGQIAAAAHGGNFLQNGKIGHRDHNLPATVFQVAAARQRHRGAGFGADGNDINPMAGGFYLFGNGYGLRVGIIGNQDYLAVINVCPLQKLQRFFKAAVSPAAGNRNRFGAEARDKI